MKLSEFILANRDKIAESAKRSKFDTDRYFEFVEQRLRQMADKRGTPVDAYASRLAEGRLFCSFCQRWHSKDAFGLDSRKQGVFRDGRASSCLKSKQQHNRDYHQSPDRAQAARDRALASAKRRRRRRTKA